MLTSLILFTKSAFAFLFLRPINFSVWQPTNFAAQDSKFAATVKPSNLHGKHLVWHLSFDLHQVLTYKYSPHPQKSSQSHGAQNLLQHVKFMQTDGRIQHWIYRTKSKCTSYCNSKDRTISYSIQSVPKTIQTEV